MLSMMIQITQGKYPQCIKTYNIGLAHGEADTSDCLTQVS